MTQKIKLLSHLLRGSTEERDMLITLKRAEPFIFDFTGVSDQLILHAEKRALEDIEANCLRLPFPEVLLEFPFFEGDGTFWVLLFTVPDGDGEAVDHRIWSRSFKHIRGGEHARFSQKLELPSYALAALGLLSVPSAVRIEHVAIGNMSLHQRRLRQGKAPFEYEHRIVGIDPTVTSLIFDTAAKAEGPTRASPALHWRRGHWRDKGTPKEKWIDATVVGDPQRGVIDHSYVVAPLSRSPGVPQSWTAPVGQELDNPLFHALSL